MERFINHALFVLVMKLNVEKIINMSFTDYCDFKRKRKSDYDFVSLPPIPTRLDFGEDQVDRTTFEDLREKYSDLAPTDTEVILYKSTVVHTASKECGCVGTIPILLEGIALIPKSNYVR